MLPPCSIPCGVWTDPRSRHRSSMTDVHVRLRAPRTRPVRGDACARTTVRRARPRCRDRGPSRDGAGHSCVVSNVAAHRDRSTQNSGSEARVTYCSLSPLSSTTMTMRIDHVRMAVVRTSGVSSSYSSMGASQCEVVVSGLVQSRAAAMHASVMRSRSMDGDVRQSRCQLEYTVRCHPPRTLPRSPSSSTPSLAYANPAMHSCRVAAMVARRMLRMDPNLSSPNLTHSCRRRRSDDEARARRRVRVRVKSHSLVESFSMRHSKRVVRLMLRGVPIGVHIRRRSAACHEGEDEDESHSRYRYRHRHRVSRCHRDDCPSSQTLQRDSQPSRPIYERCRDRRRPSSVSRRTVASASQRVNSTNELELKSDAW